MDEKEFALRLSNLKDKKGVSSREMSLSIGQNQGYINHIENGGALPSIPVFFYICDYLGITPSEFFDTENKNPTRLKAINDNLRKLNDEQLEVIEKLTEYLSKK